MVGLDEISKQLGQLISLSATTNDQVKTLFTKTDKMNEELIEHRGAIKLLGTQFTEHRIENTRTSHEVASIRREFEETKNKSKGFIMGFGLLGGGGGMAGLWTFFKALWNGTL